MVVEIGIVGKPNCGKSTLFNSLTLANVPTANYPFTTIDANVGVAYVRVRCVCREFNVKDNPVNSLCINGNRFIPIRIIDTAGLVPDAWKGRGLGNQFLSKISMAELLIHVVDASGSTDIEGRPIPPGSHDPIEDVRFLEREILYWIYGILDKHWNDIIKSVKLRRVDPSEALYSKLSGLKFKLATIKNCLELVSEASTADISRWNKDAILNFIKCITSIDKPIVIAANKIDIDIAYDNIKRMKEHKINVIPISALSEYILRKLASEKIIDYLPGDDDFKVLDESKLDDRYRKAIRIIRDKVFNRYGGTGVQKLINYCVLDVLRYIVVYPVKDPNKLTNGEGRVLPDAFLVKRGTTLREFAYLIHEDLGKHLLYGIDVRRKIRLKADYILEDNDVISVVSTV